MKMKRLIKLNNMKACKFQAADGEIGTFADIFIDDSCFAIRFFSVNTINWLPKRKVLLSPFTVGAVDEQNQLVSIELAQQQIKNSPPLGTDQPISRRYEEKYFTYYDWPPYWDNLSWPNTFHHQTSAIANHRPDRDIAPHSENHLHRANRILGYDIIVADGKIGQLKDFILDTHYWVIRFLEIDTHICLDNTNSALVPPTAILGINWPDRRITVDLNREILQNAPTHNANEPISKEYETQLLKYYNEEIFRK
ncbi:MAG: hypothetical protein ACK2TU_08300 [Anaerolineales bacterium]